MARAQINERAAKVFEMFLSANENEAEAAYNSLCKMGVKMENVARHVRGGTWETVFTHTRFTTSDGENGDGEVLSIGGF